jgi:sarcosine oxidase subunit alpha
MAQGLIRSGLQGTPMSNRLRLISHPVLNETSASPSFVTINVDGQALDAVAGETLAAALWANGILALGHNSETGDPRGIYCGIGHCYECRVTVDGIPDVRSCLTPVRGGMCVTLQKKDSGSGHDD